MHSFNGQINISRDLRQNKQTVIGRYDLIDIVFLCLGIGTAVLLAYLLGFSPIKIVDEFTAILISIFPMVLIISLGFKRVAGIRQINFIRMKLIDKKTKHRLNRKVDKSQIGDRFIVGFEIDRKYVNKYINKFLSYNNLAVLSVRYIRDVKTNKHRVHFIFNLRYKRGESVLEDIVDKFMLNNEIKALSVDDMYKLEDTTKEDNRLVYMLNFYDVKKYRSFISKVKLYADVICYFKKDGKTKYVNTFLVVKDEIKRGKKLTKLEKLDRLCDEYGIILDKLTKEQNAGKLAISYLLTNPFNAYRVYK